jgi:pimeloyl-ACP methyl ester carboxylesterase
MRSALARVIAVIAAFSGVAFPGASVPAHAAGSHLVWTECAGIANPALECASVRVPLDHRRPRGRKIEIAISRLASTDPARRRGILLTTGGGPGGPGVQLPDELSRVLPADLLAQYDLVGFDIRFLERSTPITCGQPEEEPGGFWVRVSTPNITAEEARRYARTCQDSAGWALPHATTANAARDMDLIRQALGEAKISYLGSSYAGLLGATYATLFPNRVDRFVLDSPVNGSTIWRPFELSRTPDFERGLDALSAWIAERDAAFGFGATAAEVESTLTGLVRQAIDEPIVAGGHAWTGGEIGVVLVLGGFYEQLFPVVAADLAAIRAGQAPPVPLPIRPATPPGIPADNHTAVNTAYRCGDNAWPRTIATYTRDFTRYGTAYPAYGPANANINPCAFWPTAADNRVPLPGHGHARLLVLAALRDVSVPIANSRAVAAAFPGSRLVTIDAQTHAPFPAFGNACLNTATITYLTTGTLPPANLTC